MNIFSSSCITQVEWGSEMECFSGIATELSNFYCFRASPFAAPDGPDRYRWPLDFSFFFLSSSVTLAGGLGF